MMHVCCISCAGKYWHANLAKRPPYTSMWTWLGVWSLGYGIQFQTGGLQAWISLPSMFGIQPQSQCLLLNVEYHWGWIPNLRFKNKWYTNLPWKFTAYTKLAIQNQHLDWKPCLRSKNKKYTNLPLKSMPIPNLWFKTNIWIEYQA